ncbi:MAG: mechanosensitive ion channel family protein, partial [bacterium]|nr:mechanosensitive ion channel family protein [bacterium]
MSRRTKSEVDDRIAIFLRPAIVWSIVFVGIGMAAAESDLPASVDYGIRGVLITCAALFWAVAGSRVGRVLLDVLSRRVDEVPLIQPKTMPLFDMVLKVIVVGAFLYFICIAWNVPLTSWLTSAGIVGIAVGFAAKDTLSNLFSGIFIIADAPYKMGDFIILDQGLRGVVTEIGIRSTRLLTRDDIEVTVPNAVIGNAKIINETSGPHQKMRVRVKTSVSYDSDIDQVREVLLGCVEGVQHVVPEPAPRVRFREFGDSGLLFELLAWIEKPVYRGRVLDALNGKVLKAFREAG